MSRQNDAALQALKVGDFFYEKRIAAPRLLAYPYDRQGDPAFALCWDDKHNGWGREVTEMVTLGLEFSRPANHPQIVNARGAIVEMHARGTIRLGEWVVDPELDECVGVGTDSRAPRLAIGLWLGMTPGAWGTGRVALLRRPSPRARRRK